MNVITSFMLAVVCLSTIGTAFTPSTKPHPSPTKSCLFSRSSLDNDDDSSIGSNSGNRDMKDRRSAISTAAGIITSGVIATGSNPTDITTTTIKPLTIVPAASASEQPPASSLYSIVNKIEKGKYFGPDLQKLKNKEPLYKANSNGAPEKHLPKVSITNGNDVEININHVMKEEHYIQFVWLREMESDEVVIVKACTPEEEKPFLKVQVPSGVTLTPCLYCNLHGLWKGEPFTVA